MTLFLTAAALSCAMSSAPDGSPIPDGSIPIINLPIPDDFAASLASRMAPEPAIAFANEPDAATEWILGLKKESERRMMVARLKDSMLNYDVRIGWIELNTDGNSVFEETAVGTCRLVQTSGNMP